MKTVLMADPVRFPRMTTAELRESFLHNTLYEPGKINFNYVVDADRAAIGMVAPVDAPIALPTYPQLRAAYFTERRELGALNIGGNGIIKVAGKSYDSTISTCSTSAAATLKSLSSLRTRRIPPSSTC